MTEDPSRRRFLKRVTTALAAGASGAVSPKAAARARSAPQAAPQSKPKNATVEDRVKHIIVEHLGVDEAKVVPKARLAEDLGADSLDVVELLMACEEAFDIEIECGDEEKLRTVEDLVRYVQTHLKPPKDSGSKKSTASSGR
ncbi:MAG TPA: acyl carrier protein [Terriglobia bacterium]